jgi:regulator of sigma D
VVFVFGFLGEYFKSKKANDKKVKPVLKSNRQDGFSIKYDPNLIDELESDHAKLVAIYERIWTEGFKESNFSQTSTLIGQFKSMFQAHLLTENVKFYVYLEQTLANDPHNLKIVKEFRTDMNEIANTAVKFCKTYQGKFNSEMIHKFEDDYKAIGEVLTRRVSLEEKSLYVLYQPH